MSVRYVNPIGLKQQTYYTHGIVRPGHPVFLTGQVAWDENGDLIGEGDIAAQMAQIWKNIEIAVTALGATLDDIVKLVTFSTSREWLPAIHAERGKHFQDGRFPASTFVLVAGLVDPQMLVEIDVTVMLPETRPE
jgi:enamine deaminase RidA (YjgF/YER057c/UK114 family)